MSDSREQISDQELGDRLRIAREKAKLTQADAARALDVARTTVVAMEQGQRRVRIDELQRLASLYGTSANSLLRRETVFLDLLPRFRKLNQSSDLAIEEASTLLNNLAKAEVELENALGVERVRNYPPERPILPGDVKSQAEHDAQDLRDWLGLGPGTVGDLLSVLDLYLGVRIYLRPLDARISGLFIYDDRAGACMLLNANHPRERIMHSAAHELGHLVSTRSQPEVIQEGEKYSSREERYADSFARSLLMPARAVRQRFADLTSGQTHLTRRHVILLAQAFGVSREALVRRLEELGLARSGTWDWFQSNGGITEVQVQQVLGRGIEREEYRSESQGVIPPRLTLLAREAWKRSIYSEGQLARLLELDRFQTRELLEDAEYEEGEADELFKLLH